MLGFYHICFYKFFLEKKCRFKMLDFLKLLKLNSFYKTLKILTSCVVARDVMEQFEEHL